jgi:hypothetical protein
MIDLLRWPDFNLFRAVSFNSLSDEGQKLTGA